MTENIFTDYVYHRVPNEVILQFVKCMHNPSNAKTNEFFDILKGCVINDSHEVAQGIATQVDESKDDFSLMIEREGTEQNIFWSSHSLHYVVR